MPHQRSRHALPFIKKQATFWPVVGLIGLRQVGKSTLLRGLPGIASSISFDDDDSRSDAEASAKAFLARLTPPLIIDEAQKVPSIFDAVKSAVDRKRIPGTYYLTGSSSFSAQKDIQESLTGRIGLCELGPLTLAESFEKPLAPKERLRPVHTLKPRFGIEQLAAQALKGGMPVPMFSRDAAIRRQYWKNWLGTTLGRDVARVFGKGYNPDFAEKTLYELGRLHEQGIFPTLADFRHDSRKVKKYLNAFRAVFMVRMLPCHESGTGRDVYFFTDSGLAEGLMNPRGGEEATLAITRVFILNEIIASTHYAGLTPRWNYFKSRKGAPVDLVWDSTPLRIISSVQRTSWDERAVQGAMKALGSPRGILVGPTDHAVSPRGKGISLVPWTHWS